MTTKNLIVKIISNLAQSILQSLVNIKIDKVDIKTRVNINITSNQGSRILDERQIYLWII